MDKIPQLGNGAEKVDASKVDLPAITDDMMAAAFRRFYRNAVAGRRPTAVAVLAAAFLDISGGAEEMDHGSLRSNRPTQEAKKTGCHIPSGSSSRH